MGLLVIVIIISLLLIFAVSYYMKPVEDPTDEIIDQTLASGLVSAILYTDSQCDTGRRDSRFMDLIEDCVMYPPQGSSYLVCGGGSMRSCDFAAEKIEYILRETLGTWEKAYEFRVLGPTNDVVPSLNLKGTAPETGNVETFTQTLSIRQGTMTIQLCIGGEC